MQRNPVVKTYEKLAKFSIAPIYYPIKMMNSHGQYDFASPIIGCLLLPWSPIATPFTLLLGGIGIIGYSFIAPFEAIDYIYRENHPDKKNTDEANTTVNNTNRSNINISTYGTYKKHTSSEAITSELKLTKDEFEALKKESESVLQDVDKILKPTERFKLTQTSSNLYSSSSTMITNVTNDSKKHPAAKPSHFN